MCIKWKNNVLDREVVKKLIRMKYWRHVKEINPLVPGEYNDKCDISNVERFEISWLNSTHWAHDTVDIPVV